MFYMKANGRFATAVPNSEDVLLLEELGIGELGKLARTSPVMQARIQRLVDGNYLPEGSY